MKKSNNLMYIIGFCLTIWMILFLDRVFLWQDHNTISKLVAQIEIVINFITIIPTLKIYIMMNKENRKILILFVITAVGLLIADVFWYGIMYLNDSSRLHISLKLLLISIIPFCIWNISSIIFFLRVLNKYVLQITTHKGRIVLIFAITNFVTISLYLLSIHYAGEVFSLFTMLQISTFIMQIIVFDFVVLCLIYSESRGFTLFLSGCTVMISGDFFCVYSTIGQTELLLSYGELLYLLGLLLVWFGIFKIYYDRNYIIKDWVRKDSTIKGKLAFWCFSVGIVSFLLFFALAYIFSIISRDIFVGLPLFIMIYSVVIVLFSVYVGKYFEAPFRQLAGNIKTLMLNGQHGQINDDFSIEEFMFLQDVILEVFKHKEEAKVLELENKAFQASYQEQEKFRKQVGKMVHDIRSPISTLQMTVQSTLDIPEDKRIALRDAAITIFDITGDLLRQYEPDNVDIGKEEQQMVLVSTILANIVSDRRHKCKDLPIKFIYEMNQLNAFIFIKVEPSAFKRVISNLIDNAIEALPKAGGTVELKLRRGREWVTILVDDNGVGIPQHILDKIENKEIVTYGKSNGHGLGVSMVRDMVEQNYGEFEINSCTAEDNAGDSGTVVEVRFPRKITPDWVCEEIALTKDDIIIILDDDTSIHGGWDSRLGHIIQKVPTITAKHFTDGSSVIDFVDSLPQIDKERVCLLSDYELIGQKLNGLDIIAQTKIKRSILVTSHYANLEVRKTAMQNKVKILSKDLVHIVPIKVIQSKVKGELVNVHMVFVDDLPAFTRDLIINYYGHLIVDSYTNPLEFLDEVDKYPKDTRIILDNLYSMDDDTLYPVDGVEIARQLHEKGYTQLFLLSGEYAKAPEYLKLILKTDQVSLSKLDKL